MELTLLGQGETDGDGRFRFEAPRTSSAGFLELFALAAAPGFGIGWATLNADAPQPVADLRLHAEQTARLKLVDISGRPAPGVEVGVRSISRPDNKGGWEGASLWPNPPQGLRAWPTSAKTDDQGKVAIAQLVPGYSVNLIVSDPRYARQNVDIEATSLATSKEITVALEPARIIEGRVLAADTGQPIPNAAISVRASYGVLGPMFTSKFRADDQGRFRVSPHPGDYFRMRVEPADGQPYLVDESEFEWIKGAVKKEIDIKLPAASLLKGVVIDEATKRPVAGASVRSVPEESPAREPKSASKSDGSFQLALAAGEGFLFVYGPNLNFIPKEIGSSILYARLGPETRQYAHDIVAYNIKPGDPLVPLTIALRPGKTVRGRVVGPAGETVIDAVVLSRQQLDPRNRTWLSHDFIHARDGRLELPGLDPDKAAPAYFLDADHQWGCCDRAIGQAGQ